jgi:hypothetical protein
LIGAHASAPDEERRRHGCHSGSDRDHRSDHELAGLPQPLTVLSEERIDALEDVFPETSAARPAAPSIFSIRYVGGSTLMS